MDLAQELAAGEVLALARGVGEVPDPVFVGDIHWHARPASTRYAVTACADRRQDFNHVCAGRVVDGRGSGESYSSVDAGADYGVACRRPLFGGATAPAMEGAPPCGAWRKTAPLRLSDSSV